MATSLVSDTKFIDVGVSPVTLTIQVGYAQAGGSYVVVINSDGSRNEIKPTSPGVYQVQLPRQSILSCVTTVQDINLSTNDTSVQHIFSTGEPASFTYTKQVEHQNDKVVYDIQFITL